MKASFGAQVQVSSAIPRNYNGKGAGNESSHHIIYIGECRKEFPIGKLPLNREILQVFQYHHSLMKKKISEAARITADLLLPFWKAANIPVKKAHKISDQIISLFNEWKMVKKNRKRNSKGQLKRETTFLSKMEEIFDIAVSKALEMMINEKDRNFLIGQRTRSYNELLSEEKISDAKEQLIQERMRCDRYGRPRKRIEMRLEDTLSASESDGKLKG